MGGAARDGVVTADVVAEVITNSSKKVAVAVVAVDVEVAVAEEVAAGGAQHAGLPKFAPSPSPPIGSFPGLNVPLEEGWGAP